MGEDDLLKERTVLRTYAKLILHFLLTVLLRSFEALQSASCMHFNEVKFWRRTDFRFQICKLYSRD